MARSTVDDLIRSASQGDLQPVYVIVGPELVLAERALAALKAACAAREASGSELTYEALRGAGLKARDVLERLQTRAMFSQGRLLVVRDADAVAAAELEALLEYMKQPAPDTCLVLCFSKLDARIRFTKQIDALGVTYGAEPPNERAIRSVLQELAKDEGLKLSGDAIERLTAALGTDLGELRNALRRVALYAAGSSVHEGALRAGDLVPIDAAMIEACVEGARPESIWTLVDAAAAGDRVTALRTLERLLADREPPLRILAMLAREIRLLARVKGALDAKVPAPQALKEAGAPPWKARTLIPAAARFTTERLAAALRTLAEADRALKGSRVPGDRLIEMAILKLCP